MPLDWDASAKDLDDQLNNEMANAAISKMIDTSPKNSAQIEIGMPNKPASPETTTEDTGSNRKFRVTSHTWRYPNDARNSNQ